MDLGFLQPYVKSAVTNGAKWTVILNFYRQINSVVKFNF